MVLMILALILLTVCCVYFLEKLFDAIDFYDDYKSYCADEILTVYYLRVAGIFAFLAGFVLMLVGSIRGSRGNVLFGIGILLGVLYLYMTHLHYLFKYIDELNDDASILLILTLSALSGVIMAGIGCLTKVKGLKIAGAIVMIVCFLGMIGGYATINTRAMDDEPGTMQMLGIAGTILMCVAILTYPLVRVRKS